MTVHTQVSALDAALAEARATYRASRPGSATAFEDATRVMPGGNTRTVLFHGPYPLRVSGGSGAQVTDVDGHSYLNLLGEYTAGLFGSDDRKIRQAVVAAMEGGINLGAHNVHEPRFAAAICHRFPTIEKVRFTNSGTEANMMAITTARAFTGRSKIAVFSGGYHGGVFLFKPGIKTNAPFPWIELTYNDTDGARAAIRDNADDLAAVLVEPMQGSGGCIPGNLEFLKMLREETARTGAFLIFDEVMTSRLGESGAQGLFDIQPDLTTLGKWVGGGMSFGAFGGRSDAMDLYDPRRPDAVAHAGTFQNNVLTMAAGIVALKEVYTPERAEKLTGDGNRLRDQINRIAGGLGVAVQVCGMGSLMNLHPVAGEIRCLDDLAKADDRIRELLFLDLLEEGIYIAQRGFIALSLAVTADDLSRFLSAFERILQKRRDLLALPASH